jgi:hypothetical protein
MVILLGMNHDGAGHRVLRQNGEIVTSIHVRTNPDDAAFQASLAEAKKNPAGASTFFKDHFNLEGGLLDLGVARGSRLKELTNASDAAQVQPSPVVQVGNAPGHGGSRFALNPKAPSPSAAARALRTAAGAGKGRIMPDDEADATITSARDAGQLLRYLPGFTKSGQSGERYQFYSKARTWQQYDSMRKEYFTSGLSGTSKPKAVVGDLRNDVARGILTFVNADTPVAADSESDGGDAADGSETDDNDNTSIGPAAAAVVDAGAKDGGAGDGSDSDDSSASDDDASADGDDGDGTVPIYSLSGKGGLWGGGRLRAHCATAAALSAVDRDMMAFGLAKRSAYVDLPAEVVLRAAAMTSSGGPVSTKDLTLKRVLELPPPQRDRWMKALHNEVTGLKEMEAWVEVLRADLPSGTRVVPSQLCWDIKSDGTEKCRFVARGDLTFAGEHFLETKSSMAAIETVRTQVATAAGEGWKLYSTDVRKAFPNAPEENPDLYLELPPVPPEFEGTAEWGHGCQPKRSGKYVAHMKRNLYGLKDAGRKWQQFFMTWLIEELDVRFYLNDRNAFEWTHAYTDDAGTTLTERLIGTLHVDDILMSVQGERVRAEFMRLLRARFVLTGCENEDDEATKFTGIQIRRDWARQTVTLHQSDYAAKLLEKHGLDGARTEPMPYKATHNHLVPWDGERVSEKEHFEYMCLIGDLIWLCKTRVDISWRASDLARFTNNPGPLHFDAVDHLLRYIKGTHDAGLTYHGSDEVLHQSYDHRNKLILSTDAMFDHEGVLPCVSGVVVFLNGAAIAWKVRRQTTRSHNSTEAEVKACSLGVELLRSVMDLYGEMMHQGHGAVRTLIDSTGAKSLIEKGMEAKASAPYKRAQFACEEAVEQGLIWLDLVPGSVNPSDVCTKQIRDIGEFHLKSNVVSGFEPDLFESPEVSAILEGSHSPSLEKLNKKKKKKKNPKTR